MIATVTLKLAVLIDGDELLSASLKTDSIAVSGLTPGEALTARDAAMRVLDDREVTMDVATGEGVLLVHRLVQHPIGDKP